VVEIVRESIAVKQRILESPRLLEVVDRVARAMVEAFRAEKKVLLCGNGGSAADAQHIAAELSGRFYFDRKALFAEALHANTSYLTAVANDYSYAEIFSRLVQGCGRKGDVLIAISTSGNSENVVRAVQAARATDMIAVGMTGEGGGRLRELCHHLIEVPSRDTARIQECHITLGHILCELVEATLFPK
jgi:D-sedoheptulose 7-phosphate isomerase